jgi:hypothetical protein
MEYSGPNWDQYTIVEHLRQVSYWQARFETSRNVNHIDNAERHAEVVRAYLPKCFQDLSIIGLCNLYKSSPSLSNPDRSGG